MTTPKSFHGSNLDDALSAASNGLGSRLEELHYEVVESADDEGVVVNAEIDPVAVLGLFLSETLGAGELDITARLAVQDEALEGEREFPDNMMVAYHYEEGKVLLYSRSRS